MTLIKCKECGKKFSDNAESCPNCGNPNTIESKKKIDVTIVKKEKHWSTAKLVIGIISMVLFFLVSLQSCAAGLGNALAENDSTSGSSGMLCAIFMLTAGIVTVATRNSAKKGGTIASIILYFLGAIVTIGTGDTYPDLPIWGSISFSFALVNLGSIFEINDAKKKKLLVAGIIVVSIISFIIACSTTGNKEENEYKPANNNYENVNNNNSNDSGNNSKSNKNQIYSLGDTFTFSNLEITLGNDYSFTTVDNEYSDNYGDDVVRLSITVKNLKNETNGLNMFNYKIFGSKGTEVKEMNYYFDDNIDEAGDLRSGASYTKYMYFLYDGDGKYAIEFDNWIKKTTVEFSIKK